MKKIALWALTVLMLLTVVLMPMSVAADDPSDASETPTVATTSTRELNPSKFNVTVGSATAKQGDVVEIPVIVETNPGVWGLSLDVHYDENIMVLQSAVFSDEFKKDMSCLDLDNLDDTKDSNYYIPFGLNATGNSLSNNVKTTGLFATLTFLVIPGAELGDTDIRITYKPNNVIDVDGNNVKAAMYEGYVTVTKGKPAEPGVTYFPSRTRKSITTPNDNKGGLSNTTLIIILVGVVLIVGVVLAILVIRKPADNGGKATKAVPAKPDDDGKADKEIPAKSDDDASNDDSIDDQA